MVFKTFVSGMHNPTRTFIVNFWRKVQVVFGWHGNCTDTHFFQIEWHGFRKSSIFLGKKTCPAFATFTYRSPNHLETKVYFRPRLKLADVNSEHVARRWGKPQEAPHGIIYTYEGILGRHVEV